MVDERLESKEDTERRGLRRDCVEVREYLREFSDTTTLHGVRYVGEKNSHFIERLCWIVAICACTLFCGLEMSKVWTRWQNSPVIISFAARPTNVASIPLPALTICPENKVRRSVLDVGEKLDVLARQLKGEMDFHTEEERLLVEAISMFCVSKDKELTHLLPSEFIPTERHKQLIYNNISYRIEDIFAHCFFESYEVGCREIFRPIMTNYGVCFTFNTQNDLELFSSIQNISSANYKGYNITPSTWDPEKGYNYPRSKKDFPYRCGVYVGPRTGLQVMLKSPAEDVQETCSIGHADTFRVTIQPPMDLPDPYYGNFFHLTPGTETSVSLRPSTVITAPELRANRCVHLGTAGTLSLLLLGVILYTPQVRGCNYPEDRQLGMFRTYTEATCIINCESDTFRKHLGCHLYYLPQEKNDTLPYCSVAKLIPTSFDANFSDKFSKIFYDDVEEQLDKVGVAAVCDCLPSCTEYKYDYHVTHAKYESPRISNSTERENYAVINMYFEDPTFFGKHRSELYGVTDFIASCGGLLGLFTGFSVVTAVEVFYFASLRLACRLRRNRAVGRVEE